MTMKDLKIFFIASLERKYCFKIKFLKS